MMIESAGVFTSYADVTGATFDTGTGGQKFLFFARLAFEARNC